MNINNNLIDKFIWNLYGTFKSKEKRSWEAWNLLYK